VRKSFSETMMHCLSPLLGQVAEKGIAKELISRLIEDGSGVTAVEYGLIAALIAVAAVVIMGTAGTNLSGVFSQVAASL
jgi:pilus assembly protein Flp/PilA